MTIITFIGITLYYLNAILRHEPRTHTMPTRNSWRVMMHKLWYITQANGIYLAIGISAVFYLEGRLFINAVIMTIVGFSLFYIYAYETTPNPPYPQSDNSPFTWRTFLRSFWSITETNILFVAGAVSLLLYVTGKPLLYTAVCLAIGFVMFYRDAFATYYFPNNWNSHNAPSRVHRFFTKIWRITCANALGITGGLSLLIFVEKQVYTMALVLTVISVVIFYIVSYRDFGDIDDTSITESFSFPVFSRRLIHITLANALWVFVGVTYIFFATGMQMIYLAVLTFGGFVLLYIDEYDKLLRAEYQR